MVVFQAMPELCCDLAAGTSSLGVLAVALKGNGRSVGFCLGSGRWKVGGGCCKPLSYNILAQEFIDFISLRWD